MLIFDFQISQESNIINIWFFKIYENIDWSVFLPFYVLASMYFLEYFL